MQLLYETKCLYGVERSLEPVIQKIREMVNKRKLVMRKVTEAHSNVILKFSLEKTLFSYIIINHKENRYLSGFTRSGQLSGQQLKTVGSNIIKSLKYPNL